MFGGGATWSMFNYQVRLKTELRGSLNATGLTQVRKVVPTGEFINERSLEMARLPEKTALLDRDDYLM